MKIFIIHLAAWVACSCVLAQGQDYDFELKSWRALEDRDVARLGRAVMRGNARSWVHAESDRFTYHAATRQRLERVMRETEWSYAEVTRRLGLPPAKERGHLFVVEDEGDWSRVMRAAGRRTDGVALHVGREIFILRDEFSGRAYVDVPHEMVHYRIAQVYGRGAPLWLEEGLAEYLGWETALAYHAKRGLNLYREQAALSDEDWIPWPELFAMESYPDEPTRAAAFYRQTGRLLEEVADVIGKDRIGALTASVVRDGGTLREALKNDHEIDGAEFVRMLDRVEFATKHPVERAE